MDLQISKPLTLPCGLTLPNRLVKAAMAENMADGRHLPGEIFRATYGEWADGGWGMVLTGNVQVDAHHLGSPKDTAVDATHKSHAYDPWKELASVCVRNGTPTIMQINHPGRQSPLGAGERGLFSKTLAPSAVPLRIGDGLLPRVLASLIFGTPKEMSVADIEDVVQRFAQTAKLAADTGFSGVELHAAHGYLLAQFLSAKVNKRTDEYGGTPAKRAKIIVDIIQATRAIVPKEFAVGIKLNSVDHQSETELRDCIEQLQQIVEAGVDFVEISGGSYEDPLMIEGLSKETVQKSERTKAREAFFLEFAEAIRSKFPSVPLMVTGGFRTRAGMEAAVSEGACDLVGVGRPACINAALPKNIVFNAAVKDEDAHLDAPRIHAPSLLKMTGVKAIGAGAETEWYSKQIRKMGKQHL